MLLINPVGEKFGGWLGPYMAIGMPAAIGILSAYLGKHGHKTNVVDDEMEMITEDNIEIHVQNLNQPYVFGITVLTAQVYRAYNIAKMLKKKYPDCIIIMGGIHVTAIPGEALKEGADIVVRGEGEETLRLVYEAILDGKDWRKVDGISYRDQSGVVKNSKDALLIRDLDDVPMFPYHLFQSPRYDRAVLISSRGCPYTCTYCSQRLVTGTTYRYHSVDRIIENINLLVYEYKQKSLTFDEDNFAVHKSRVKKLCDAIVAQKYPKDVEFKVQTRADNLYKEIMPYLKKANFTGVSFGLETASERLIKVINKEHTVQTCTESIKLAREYGMDVTALMIMGLPSETREDRNTSVNYIYTHGLRFTKFNNLIPYPGTKLYNMTKNTPQIHVKKNWQNFNSTLAGTSSLFSTTPLPYVPENTTPWQLKRDIIKANYGFYFRPKPMIDLLLGRGNGSFVELPKRWYFKPKEIYQIIKLGSTIFGNYLVSLLPDKIGEFMYVVVTGEKLEDRTSLFSKNKNRHPEAIDGSMRNIRVESPKMNRRRETILSAN